MFLNKYLYKSFLLNKNIIIFKKDFSLFTQELFNKVVTNFSLIENSFCIY